MNKRQAQEKSDLIVLKLRQERLRQGITQYKLAQETGMSKSSVLYIENLTQKPSLYTIIMIADYLGVDLSEYF